MIKLYEPLQHGLKKFGNSKSSSVLDYVGAGPVAHLGAPLRLACIDRVGTRSDLRAVVAGKPLDHLTHS